MTVVRSRRCAVEAYRELVRQALAEDIGRGDVTTAATVAADQRATAVLVAKSACVLAGLDVFCEALRQCDPDVEIRRSARATVTASEPGTVVAEVRGQAAGLLTAERTALNFIQRLTRHRHAGASVRRRGRRPLSSCSTRARRRRSSASSRNTPCAPAAPPTTGCGSTTAC